jgi:hypothetical protein
LIVVGLNPSTATPKQLDPTIKRISKIVQREQFGGLMIDKNIILDAYMRRGVLTILWVDKIKNWE